MGMLRIVLRDGQIMHLEADMICVEERTGVLKLCDRRKDGTSGVVAMFAPGIWAYYLWVKLGN